jgi:hypothetical protein
MEEARSVVTDAAGAVRATAAMNAGVAYVVSALEAPETTEVTRETHGHLSHDMAGFARMVREFEELDVYLRWLKRDAPVLYADVRRTLGA